MLICFSCEIPTVVSAEDCIRRDYGRSSFVCVCNATYCDTAPNVGSLASGQAIQITSSQTAARFLITNLQFGRKLEHIRAISKPSNTFTVILQCL